jgi:hypothetical protein
MDRLPRAKQTNPRRDKHPAMLAVLYASPHETYLAFKELLHFL